MTASKLLNGQLILEEYFVVNPEFDGQYGPFCKRASTLAALVNPEFDGQYGLCCMRASTLAAQKNSGVWLHTLSQSQCLILGRNQPGGLVLKNPREMRFTKK